MATAVQFSAVSYGETPMARKKECPRRDSLSSSRTGDSGYVSDVEAGLSPLEVWGAWQVPHTSSDFTCDSSALFDVKEVVASSRTKRLATADITPGRGKRYKAGKEERPTPRIEVTSNPQDQLVAAPGELRGVKRKENVELWVKDSLHPGDCPKERNLSIVSLDSTGSCDMYSNTEDNSDDEHASATAPSHLSKAALTTIELILRKMELNLNHAAYTQCAGSHSSRTTGASSSSSRPSRSTQPSSSKRKGSSLPPSDPSDDDFNKKRRTSTTTTPTEDSESGPRFACPFYKHDPARYRHRRTCGGPGWPTVHRMKEHLYRSHAQPIFCPRCYLMFDADADFSAHIRGDPCATAAPQPIEGIDRKTFEGLKKRSPTQRLEEDKWRDAYQLLFPGVDEGEIPSPYYDSDAPSETSRRFRRELLARVRTELLATAEVEAGPVEQRLLRQVAGIIRRCEAELLETVYGSRNLSVVSVSESRRSSAVEASGVEAFTVEAPVVEASTQMGSSAGLPMRGSEVAAQGFGVWEGLPFELIDWDVAFPPGVEMQGEQEGAFAVLNHPVWTT